MVENPRDPVLIGCGQLLQRADTPGEGAEPVELMARAAARAEEDSGVSGLLRQADSIRVAQGVWDYSNPADLLRSRFDATGARTGLAPVSGNMVQRMINLAALDIAAGRLDLVLVAGGEAEHSKRRCQAAGIDPGWTLQKDSVPDDGFGAGSPFLNRFEVELGLIQPAGVFSLFENAMRFERGESIEAHRERISELWVRFNAVAHENPYAWTRELLSAEEIGTPSPSNKLVSHPYTKRLCANMVVDQAAAVILCSAEAAMRLGVDRERWVHLHAATDVQKTPFVSERWDFRSAPALAMAARRVLELANTQSDEIAHVDLYSCFPAAVQLGAAELGRPLDPAPTVTGGLGFAGGPFNSYVLHSTASMMDRLRGDPGSLGLVSSIGGWLNKHAFAIYSTHPPAEGFRYADLDSEVGALPVRRVEQDTLGAATVETYVLQYVAGAPASAIVACLRENGRRVWATIDEPAILEAMTRKELCGSRVSIREGNVLDPG
ncbi:MAG: hypothetical protein JRH19_19455 [Deltaproteobacteria bacterium]|nr:hypothetical protein [Deltaproteobacteria bacterium]